MRIAISGTHCCGKSTLIDEFLNLYPNFTHEPEAYEALQDEHGETFPANPGAEDYYRQLEYCVGRLKQYISGDCVIFERCPADYLAYMLALADLGLDPTAQLMSENSINIARRGMQELDTVAFLRPDDRLYELPDEEDLKLRSTVDTKLEAILLDDEFDLLANNHPLILEVSGTTTQRLQMLEAALRSN